MSIVWHEIRKIWNLKILLVVIAFCALFYSMSMRWEVYRFLNPMRETRRINFADQLRERYGYSITAEEMENFLAETWPLLLAEADEHIQRLPIFAERGITSYLEFREVKSAIWTVYDDEDDNEWAWEASAVIAFEEADFIGMMTGSLEQVQSLWDRQMLEWEWDMSHELRAWSETFYQSALLAVEQNRLAEFVAEQRAIVMAEAEELIANSSAFAAVGVTNFAEFEEYRAQIPIDPAKRRVWNKLVDNLLRPEYNYVANKLYHRIWPIEFILEHQPPEMYTRAIHELIARDFRPNEFEYQRLRQILETGENKHIICPGSFQSTASYFTQLVLMIAFAILILITPFLAMDRMRNIHSIQYTAKLGRRLLYRQLAAVMISALAVIVILIALFTAIFATTGQFVWWNHSVVSFLGWEISLIPLTIGQIIIVLLLMSCLFGLAVAAISFILSRFSRNVVLALFKAIPVFFMLNLLARPLFGRGNPGVLPLMFFNPLYRLTRIVGIEIIACVALPVIAVAAALWVSRRERRVDVA